MQLNINLSNYLFFIFVSSLFRSTSNHLISFSCIMLTLRSNLKVIRLYCHNPTPTQQQLNLTRLRLDLIITPPPTTHPTHPPHPHKLSVVVESKSVVGTVVTAWRQYYISLMWGRHQTVWGTSHRRVQTGTWGSAWVGPYTNCSSVDMSKIIIPL